MTYQVTADEIASHIICPRQWEFDHQRNLSPPASHPDVVSEKRRELLRNGLIVGLEATPPTEKNRVEAAMEEIDTHWKSSTYLVPAQREYDRSVIEQAVKTYFTGMGEAHAESLLETDTTLSYSRNGIRYTVDVDALIEQDGQTLAINYQPTLKGVLQLWSDDNIQAFRTGQENYRKQIASFARAGLALRAMIDDYGIDSNIDFAYVGVLQEVTNTNEGVDSAIIKPEIRRFYTKFSEESTEMRDLLESKAQAIQNSRSDPREADFQNITEKACNYCQYEKACPEKIESETAFTDHTTNHATTISDLQEDMRTEMGDSS